MQNVTSRRPGPWTLGSVVQYAAILLGNGILFAVYLGGQASFGELLWVFWSQSVLIGIANAARMGSLRQFSTKGLTSNGQPVRETAAGKWSTTVFFCFHYGIFHVVYAVFLTADHGAPWEALRSWVAIGLASFVVGEAFTLGRNVLSDRDWKPNLGTLMFTPYLRIIPMHLTILAGGALSGFGDGGTSLLVTFFLALKTLADLGMQAVDDRMNRRKAQAQRAEA